MPAPVLITKSSGELVPYEAEKLRHSLERSGATPELSARIAEALLPKVAQGMSTHKLYRLAFALLRKRSKPVAARYRLKQAILDLGPSGFPFERFVGRILAHDGYTVQVGVMVEGRCVTHEVDVLADKGAQHFLVECKYHNTPGRVCDVKVPLYIKARFDDIVAHWQKQPGNGHRFTHGWVVTNTRFTSEALRYGECAGLRMLGWDHPAKGSLKHRIDRSGLYPLTCLSSLTSAEKDRLLTAGLVLVRDVIEHPDAMSAAQVRAQRMPAVIQEASALMGG
ncbi:MAG TPA: restriction endonuclease [Flavobacteriales bacterium]|nr:restriction endonuclease [Flavobacteriales bacterium]